MFKVAHDTLATELGDDLSLRIKAHDAHRAEWIATIPLAEPGAVRSCEVTFDVAIPERLWRPHNAWKRLFVRTRLGSPRLWTEADVLNKPPTSVIAVRRQCLSAVHRLKTEAVRIRKTLRKLAAESRSMPEQLAAELVVQIAAALAESREVRRRIAAGNGEGVAAEAALARDYISAEILHFGGRVLASLDGEVRINKRDIKPIEGDREALDGALRTLFLTECTWRAQRDLVVPDAEQRESVDRYLARTSALKQHFQRALFLDADVAELDERLGNWIAAFVAIVASTWYFVWQVYYLNEAMQVGTTVVSLFMAGGVAGLLYAVKDRIKELGRRWVLRLMRDLYADREVKLHLRRDGGGRGRRLAVARETIRKRVVKPSGKVGSIGTTGPHVMLSVRDIVSHRGGIDLARLGITSIKHIFRYDVSVLFGSVDDQRKHVVVRDGNKVRVVRTRRAYRLPVRARLLIDGARMPILERYGELVIQGRKLRGLRMSTTPDPFWQAVGEQ